MKKAKISNKPPVRMDKNRVRFRKGESEAPNGTYVYRWTDAEGQRHAVYAKTLDELREKETQTVVDTKDGIQHEVKKYTINEMFDIWCTLKRGIKDSTFKNYIYMYEQFVRNTFGKRKLAEVKKTDVRKFYNALTDKGLKVSTVDGVHNILHQVFQTAVDDDMIRYNPTDNMMKEIKLVRGGDSEKKEALTKAQQDLLFSYLLKHKQYEHWYPVLFIMANTGMRAGEITGLRWCDIDIEKGLISVNHTLVYYNHRDEKGCYFSINTPKTKAGERLIPMTESVKEAFLKEREYQELAELSSKSQIDGYEDFIFLNRFGEVLNQSVLNKAIERIVRDCNSDVLDRQSIDKDPVLLPHFSCHILRHTFATRLCESGISIKTCQAILGHTDIRTTMDIYVSATTDFKKQEMDCFEEYLRTGNKKESAASVGV